MQKKHHLKSGKIEQFKQRKEKTMKKYEVIYSKSISNNIYSQIFETKTLLDFTVALENFKSKVMVYNDNILEIKESK